MKTIRLYLLLAISFVLVACDKKEDARDTSSDKELGRTQERKVVYDRNKPSHFIMGTGSVHGVYYPIGGVICRLVNRRKELHKVRCLVESTSGSVFNLKEISKGNLDLAVAQSDWQYRAYNGISNFKDEGPNKDLRAVFALESDPLAMIVRADSEYEKIEDLENKVVSFGYSRSLQHKILYHLLDAMEWTEKRFHTVVQLSDNKQLTELCAGGIESALFLSSSLTDHVNQTKDICDLRIINIEGPAVKKVIQEKPYYRTGIIKQGRYFNGKDDVTSFGLGATFVATEKTSPKAIYHVVKEVVENFKDFQSLHPSLQTLKKSELPHAGITVPLHPGAIRYFREARLMK